uniref:Uncharacterized protein n=1 Tax=Rhizophora mucronata TaxID=61149 RepID=A0A2P2PQL9_RHIMU
MVLCEVKFVPLISSFFSGLMMNFTFGDLGDFVFIFCVFSFFCFFHQFVTCSECEIC